MKLRYLIPFLLAGVALGQTVDPLPPAYVSIASEGTYQGTSPVVNLPAGTIYAFGLTTKGGVLCDPYTVSATPAAGLTVVVWVSTFSTTCTVNGKPPVDANGKPTGGDPDPGIVKNLYVLQTKGDQTGTYTVPPDPTVRPWTVTGYGGGTVIPPTTPTPTVFLCPGSPVVFTNPDGTKTQPVTLPIPTASLSGATAAANSNGPCTLYGGQ